MPHKSSPRSFQTASKPTKPTKRSPNSTIFTTTAQHLTSSVPFRWRAEQVSIFEDWISYKGANFISCDLTPLLQALELDGYENIKNDQDESVQSIIIEKVRRKLSRTKRLADEEAEAAKETEQVKVESKRSPRLKPQKSNTTTPKIKKEEGDATTRKARSPSPSNIQLRTPSSSPVADLAQPQSAMSPSTKPSPKAPVLSNLPSLPSPQASTSLIHRPAPSSQTLQKLSPARKSEIITILSSEMDKVFSAMHGFSATVSELPDTLESIALETAAYDAALELEHLKDVLGDYISKAY
ncbi:hypothetical protein GGR50DRAFT_682124 [Xylaria sp. CBS 124048]|nr:hypothetical protein GGR50DRAFT_682124 [Xylaria sp. CBS 124048]